MKKHERKVIEQFRSDYSSYILPNFDEYGAYRIIHKDAEQGDYRLVNYDSEGIFVTRNIDDDLDYEFEKPSDNDKIEELEKDELKEQLNRIESNFDLLDKKIDKIVEDRYFLSELLDIINDPNVRPDGSKLNTIKTMLRLKIGLNR